MNRAGAATVLAAVLVVLAGCSGGSAVGTASPGNTGTADVTDDGSADGDDSDDSDGGTGSTVAGLSGSVNFYVSDRPGDMDDFEHLNVTVTTVKFHLVDRANGSTVDDAKARTGADETTTVVTTTGDSDAETEAENESEDGRWVVREVNETTVDLTKLRGDNATLVEEFDAPAGEYNKVFLVVSDVDATLQNGESTRVKLPSGTLQLNTAFEVENDSEVDFVYDIMVHEAGKSGKYILRPVVSESGPDQPIDPVDERGRPVDDEGEDDRDGDDALTATLSGEPTPRENVTITVTDGDESVANATVTVNGDEVGTTGDDGSTDGSDDGNGSDDGDGGGDSGGPPDDSPGNGDARN